MGHYTGVATRLRVKKEAPSQLFEFLDYIYDTSEGELPTTLVTIHTGNNTQLDIKTAADTLCSMLLCGSAYFEAWQWRVKEDCGDHWLYESRASCKHPDIDLFFSLVTGSQAFLFLEEGDIIYRDIYEDGSVENIICFKDNKFHQREGYKYNLQEGWVGSDGYHPYNFKLPEELTQHLNFSDQSRKLIRFEEDFTPPWNITELDALLAKKNLRRIRMNKVSQGRHRGFY